MAAPSYSHESVIVSMHFNIQPAHSVDEDLPYVFHQYLVKRLN